jgi:uncharacterized membrane protein YdfJ with MMPL/SSD domain
VARRPVLERTGRFLARHAVVVVGVWVVVVAGCLALALGAFGGGSLFDRLTSGEPDVPGETSAGRALLDAQQTSGDRVLLVLDGVDPADPAVRQRVVRLAGDVAGSPDVRSVITPYTVPGGPAWPSWPSWTRPSGSRRHVHAPTRWAGSCGRPRHTCREPRPATAASRSWWTRSPRRCRST